MLVVVLSIQHSIYAHTEKGRGQGDDAELSGAVLVPRLAHLDSFPL